jgi:hypothetical protein
VRIAARHAEGLGQVGDAAVALLPRHPFDGGKAFGEGGIHEAFGVPNIGTLFLDMRRDVWADRLFCQSGTWM